MASTRPIIVVQPPPPAPAAPPKPAPDVTTRYRTTCSACKCKFEFMKHHVRRTGGWGNTSPSYEVQCPCCPKEQWVVLGERDRDLKNYEYFDCKHCDAKKRVPGEGPYLDVCGAACHKLDQQ